MQRHDGTLKDILRQNIIGARLNPGMTARQPLRGGLRVDMIVTRESGREQVMLQLSRAGHVPPSLTEWRTVIDHWPLAIGDRGAIRPERCYLVGVVPVVGEQ